MCDRMDRAELVRRFEWRVMPMAVSAPFRAPPSHALVCRERMRRSLTRERRRHGNAIEARQHRPCGIPLEGPHQVEGVLQPSVRLEIQLYTRNEIIPLAIPSATS